MKLKIKGKLNNKVNIKQQNSSEEIAIKLKETDYYQGIKLDCRKNINTSKKILANIEDLNGIQKRNQQRAEKMGVLYTPLNNISKMEHSAHILKEQLFKIDRKLAEICNQTNFQKLKFDLETIAKTNIGITALLKCLNDSKNSMISNKYSRFPEMIEIEDRELKRSIAERSRKIRGEAELKKLKDDLKIIEEKGTFKKFIGILIGRNKIDNCLEMQIRYRKMAIESTLSKKLTLVQKYDIEEILAEILMFIEENEKDELIEDDVDSLKILAEELKKNYTILDSNVQTIISQRDGKNSLYVNKKITKKEIIELETQRFLNKYGYRISYVCDQEGYEYQDTMATEIDRIITYINNLNII